MDTLSQYIQLSRCIRSIIRKAFDGIETIKYLDYENTSVNTSVNTSLVVYPLIKYILDDLSYLRMLWPVPDSSNVKDFVSVTLDCLQGGDADRTDDFLHDIIREYIPNLNNELDELYMSLGTTTEPYGLEGLIHPIIIRSSYHQFREGLYRDAVLNAIVAVFDFIRKRTGLSEDGIQLVGRAFSIDNPVLILSSLDTNSGQNEQKGFIQILQGAYIGIRNPKAHSLSMNPTKDAAAQYLVFASLLARRIEESRVIKPKPKTKPKTT